MFLLLSALLSPLMAQDAAAPTTATGAALVVRTVDADIAENLSDTFSGGKLPDLGAGACYVLTLGSDGKLAITTENAASGFMQMRAKPAMLAEIFADKIEETRQQMGMFAGMAAGQLGATPQELTALVDDVFAFPKQVEALNIDVTGSPTSSLDGKVDVLPAADGWFGKFIGELQANKAGAPAVADPDAMFQLAVNMDHAALLKAVRPFLGFAVGAAASDKESKLKYGAMMQSMVALFDGTVAMAMTGDKGQKLLCGLQDGPALATLIGSADFKAWRQASAEANPMADVEFKDAAVTHREIACNKQITEVSMPSGQDNKTTQFTAVAGSFLLGAGSESDTKSLIDAILDQKVARAALPGNALLTVSAKVAEMVRTLSNGMADGEDAPAKLDVAMHKQGTALNFTFKVGM